MQYQNNQNWWQQGKFRIKVMKTTVNVIDSRINRNNTIMKASKKMEATIARMEKKYGKLNRDYFVEVREENRVGRGFYDGCTLTCDILKNLHIVVAHDGTYYTL